MGLDRTQGIPSVSKAKHAAGLRLEKLDGAARRILGAEMAQRPAQQVEEFRGRMGRLAQQVAEFREIRGREEAGVTAAQSLPRLEQLHFTQGTQVGLATTGKLDLGVVKKVQSSPQFALELCRAAGRRADFTVAGRQPNEDKARLTEARPAKQNGLGGFGDRHGHSARRLDEQLLQVGVKMHFEQRHAAPRGKVRRLTMIQVGFAEIAFFDNDQARLVEGVEPSFKMAAGDDEFGAVAAERRGRGPHDEAAGGDDDHLRTAVAITEGLRRALRLCRGGSGRQQQSESCDDVERGTGHGTPCAS